MQDAVRKAVTEEVISVVGSKSKTSLNDMEITRGEYYEELIREAKYMILEDICAFPIYQRLGITTELVRWGTRRADKEVMNCWLHSSEAAHMLFKWEGFEVMGMHMVDLDKYATILIRKQGMDTGGGIRIGI